MVVKLAQRVADTVSVTSGGRAKARGLGLLSRKRPSCIAPEGAGFCLSVRGGAIGADIPTTVAVTRCIAQRRSASSSSAPNMSDGRVVAQRFGDTGAARSVLAAVSAGMPTPVWDTTGGPAMMNPPRGGTDFAVEKGNLHRVVWMCWTGNNPMSPFLQICKQTVEKNCGLPVVLVTPENMLQFVPDPHPAYEFLHLAHRADYLRCYLLHHYGGIYLDVDTICLRSLAGLFDLLDKYDAVGYDGSQWGELIGISDMGPFRPGSQVTQLWFGALHGKLQQRWDEIRAARTDVFYWQEILRDIVVPVTLNQRHRVTPSLLAFNPEQDELWSTERVGDVLGSPLSSDPHVVILNNAKYGKELGGLSEKEILGGPAVLSQLLRHALSLTESCVR